MSGTRYAGRRLSPLSSVKVRGINLNPQVTDGTFTNNINSQLWSNWKWATFIQPSIDLAIGLGANTVKLSGGLGQEVLAGVLTMSQALIQYRQFLGYTAARGLMVYDTSMNSGASVGTEAQTLSVLSQVATELDKWPHVIAMDLWNEGLNDYGTSGSLSLMAKLCATAKLNTTIPVTVSAQVIAAGSITTRVAQLTPIVDFFDFHPYYSANGLVAPADTAAIKSAGRYRPYLMGECGENAAVAPHRPRWNALGQIAGDPACMGSVGFCLSDYDSGLLGVYDSSLTVKRNGPAASFAGWPAL